MLHHIDHFTSISAAAMVTAIKEKQVSVKDLVTAHIEKIEDQKELNAVIWPLFDQALQQAKIADQKLSSHEQVGLLFGVPITIKDQFMIHGTPTSCGLSHRAHTPISKEGTLITKLRKQGAIFLGKTNLPQLLLSHECDHALYGTTKNPWNPKRTPGGSSGGEAAIIAAGGSPLGLACDRAGSIRVPAHCCGITGIKPTTGRFPNDDTPLLEGYFADFIGFEGFITQPGPMARHVDDLKLMMDALLSPPITHHLEAPPVPWLNGPVSNPDEIRIGVYTDNEIFKASPALRRLTHEAGKALSDQGFTVHSFDPPEPSHAILAGLRLLGSDGGTWIKQALNKEKPMPDVQTFMQAVGMSSFFRKLSTTLLALFGQHHAARILQNSGSCSASEYWHLCAERTRYRMNFLQAMNEQQVDILICPPYGLPAPLIGCNSNGVGTLASSHSFLFNILGMPAGVIAAGNVKPGEESDRPISSDHAEQDAALTERNSVGLPIGVQVAGRHWREDQVLAIMKILETHFNPNGFRWPTTSL